MTNAAATRRAAGAPQTPPPSAPATSPVESPAETYPPTHTGLPTPLALPWALKPVSSADAGVERLADGRTRFWIRHDLLAGVTPRMLAWWFAHLEGDVEIGRRRYNRYRVWHPRDHVHASYARRLPDGSVGPGAAIRLREVLGRDQHHVVDVTTEIEKLDEEGYVHLPALHVARALPPVGGLVRMEYRFTPTPRGTLYENSLTFGRAAWWSAPLMAALLPAGHGERWIRHNVEEVGLFEHFLPALYYAETGRRA